MWRRRQRKPGCQYCPLMSQLLSFFTRSKNPFLKLVLFTEGKSKAPAAWQAVLMSSFTKVTGINSLLTLHIVNGLFFFDTFIGRGQDLSGCSLSFSSDICHKPGSLKSQFGKRITPSFKAADSINSELN